MNHGVIELSLGDVSNVEARVYAQFTPAPDTAAGAITDGRRQFVLCGTLRGPYCERTRTLPAEYPFRQLDPDAEPELTAVAEAVVPDPCLWSPELPHLYHAELAALEDERIVAEFHGQIGLRQAPSKARQPD